MNTTEWMKEGKRLAEKCLEAFKEALRTQKNVLVVRFVDRELWMIWKEVEHGKKGKKEKIVS